MGFRAFHRTSRRALAEGRFRPVGERREALRANGHLIKLIYAYPINATALLAVGVVEWRRRPADQHADGRAILFAALKPPEPCS